MKDAERDPRLVLEECAPHLSLLATRALYEEQPDLWRLGEHGRARTLEDFGHHFRALASLDEEVFAEHVRYCVNLFRARGFPLRWLSDAWRQMGAVLERELPRSASSEALKILTLAQHQEHA